MEGPFYVTYAIFRSQEGACIGGCFWVMMSQGHCKERALNSLYYIFYTTYFSHIYNDIYIQYVCVCGGGVVVVCCSVLENYLRGI